MMIYYLILCGGIKKLYWQYEYVSPTSSGTTIILRAVCSLMCVCLKLAVCVCSWIIYYEKLVVFFCGKRMISSGGKKKCHWYLGTVMCYQVVYLSILFFFSFLFVHYIAVIKLFFYYLSYKKWPYIGQRQHIYLSLQEMRTNKWPCWAKTHKKFI